MTQHPMSIAVIVETETGNFDVEGLYDTLRDIAIGTVWNFITGAFIFKSLLDDQEISKILKDEYYPSHIVINLDPANTSGVLPKGAWDTFFLDVFYDDINKIAKRKGWSGSQLREIEDAKFERDQ